MATSEPLNFLSGIRATIFDEIEQNFRNILNRNERSNYETCSPALDYLPTSNTDFFLPAPEDSCHFEPQLYSVEQGELQPVSSPFMVPGIYRKIDTSVGARFSALSKPSNVFLTASEPHGRIVRVGDFQKLYVCADDLKVEMNNNGQPRRVFPKTNVEQCNEGSVKATSKTIRSESLVTKKLDALSKLAYNVLKLSSCDHIVVIDRNRNEIVRTDKNTQQKTIYRFESNEALGLEPSAEKTATSKIITLRKPKLGRPKKRASEQDITKATIPPKLQIIESVRAETQNSNTENTLECNPISTCSRFGRIIKPVRHHIASTTRQKVDEETVHNLTEETTDLISDLKDKDFRCTLKPNQVPAPLTLTHNEYEEEPTPVPIATSSPTKRHVPPESICPTCKKIFLGRRLKRHFVDHPDHMKLETPNTSNSMPINPNEEVSLFGFLVSKLQKSNLNEDQRADLFLLELNDLVEQLQLRSSRLIRNTSGLHLVTARTARVLGIPEGQYALDMTAIDATPEPEPSCLMNYEVNVLPVPSNNTRSLDYTALSLDDTLTDEAAQKLNLSAGGKLLPPSEESLLRAVDDLVPPTGITKLVVSTNLNRNVGVSTATSSNTEDTIVPHYDHASDNAVEAVTMKECNTGRQTQPMLDLAVDFFQFNAKKSK